MVGFNVIFVVSVYVYLSKGCEIEELIPNGRLDILDGGNKLEVKCDVGYIVDGPTFVYCNGMEWNEKLRGCKEHDQIYFSCDFESSSSDRFCGWKNDDYNYIDWFADNMAFKNMHIYTHHVVSGSSEYFRSHYISLSAGTYNPSTSGRLISPPLPPAASDKQKCLIFSYKVTSGIPNSISVLKVSFGGIPHWETEEGEGRAIIGLYQLDFSSEITIEGINCKAAIDNISVTEGNSCNELPYEEETDSCHDNCGQIWNEGCSCDWECHNNNNCCSDIQIKCPYIKPMDEIEKLYLHPTTTATPTMSTTEVINETLNVTAADETPTTPKNGQNDATTTDQVFTEDDNITEYYSSTIAIPTFTFPPVTNTSSTTMTADFEEHEDDVYEFYFYTFLKFVFVVCIVLIIVQLVLPFIMMRFNKTTNDEMRVGFIGMDSGTYSNMADLTDE